MRSFNLEAGGWRYFRPRIRRPRAVLVIGVLNLVIGVFGLWGGVYVAQEQTDESLLRPRPILSPPLSDLARYVSGGIDPTTFVPTVPSSGKMPIMALFPGGFEGQLQWFLDSRERSYQIAMVARIRCGLILSAILIVSGVGLLGMRPTAQRLTLLYAAASVLLQVAGMAYAFGVVMPAANNFYLYLEEMVSLPGRAVTLSRAPMWAGLALMPLGLVYPITVYVVLTRRRIVAAFENPGEPPQLPGADQLRHFHPRLSAAD